MMGERKMIVNFEQVRRSEQFEPLSPVLGQIKDYWNFSRAQQPLPLSENLFISDLVDQMPHILLAYEEKRRFQIEFAGETAACLLGGGLIGATTEPGSDLPQELIRCILKAAASREPAFGSVGAMQTLCLPFSGDSGTVDIVLVGLADTAGAGVKTAGTVISLGR